MEWKYGSAEWISLNDLKASYPVQVSEYAVTNNIEVEPALAWWYKVVLRKKKLDYIKSKIALLEENSQVWHSATKDRHRCF